MYDVVLDTIIDSIKIIPFLFFTYLLMEYIEHQTSDKFKKAIKNSGKIGPIWGSLLGAFPQCGFSTAASSLFSTRVITVGTLISIYLSTSDEMLPIFISEKVSIKIILGTIGIKILIGMIAGFVTDIFLSNYILTKKQLITIDKMCETDHCHCERSIFKSSLKHTVQILIFIVIISFALNTAIYFVSEEVLSNFILDKMIIGSVLAGIVGLIPNCAASVVVTQLYLSNIISFGSMMSGLLVGAGVGILVLFRANRKRVKENIKIVATLYVFGVLAGILLDLLKISL